MFLYHILDICPKLLSFTISSSQRMLSLEISCQLTLAVGTNELAFGYLYKNVTMTCSKEMIQHLFSRPSQVTVFGGTSFTGYQCKNSKEGLVSG